MRHVDLVDPPSSSGSSPESQQWKALPKFPREAGKPWATVWPGPSHVIFGHHARRRLQVIALKYPNSMLYESVIEGESITIQKKTIDFAFKAGSDKCSFLVEHCHLRAWCKHPVRIILRPVIPGTNVLYTCSLTHSLRWQIPATRVQPTCRISEGCLDVVQECSHASGIDTGCCLGDQLTALVLPSVSELEAKKWQSPPGGVTRESLGAQIVSVQAREQYRADDKDWCFDQLQ